VHLQSVDYAATKALDKLARLNKAFDVAEQTFGAH